MIFIHVAKNRAKSCNFSDKKGRKTIDICAVSIT
jgi:hypothetical protein